MCGMVWNGEDRAGETRQVGLTLGLEGWRTYKGVAGEGGAFVLTSGTVLRLRGGGCPEGTESGGGLGSIRPEATPRSSSTAGDSWI
jgi:hypothetical protein